MALRDPRSSKLVLHEPSLSFKRIYHLVLLILASEEFEHSSPLAFLGHGVKALAAHPFHCPLSRDHWCECFACTTFSQPSSCGHQYGSSISEPFSLPSSCGLQYGSSVSTPVPSARPSRCLHLAAFNTGVPSACPSHCFTLRPSIREFHQHALLVALPCRLQYGSSISTPFSLLHLVAFNTRVPSARPSRCLTSCSF